MAREWRDILAPLTPQDLGNEAFPFLAMRETTIGDVPVRMVRVTFVGELGWELHVPMAEMGPREVTVAIERGGICGSDLHYYHAGGFGVVRVKEPMVLGHEIAGRVLAVSEIGRAHV